MKLAISVKDISGVSVRSIFAALIDGRADPATNAELANVRLRSKIPVLEQALTGLVRDHHRRLLAVQVAHIDFLDEQLEALSTDITPLLTDLSAAPTPPPPAAPGGAGAAGGAAGVTAAGTPPTQSQ